MRFGLEAVGEKKHVHCTDKYIALSFELEIGIIRGVHNLSRSSSVLITWFLQFLSRNFLSFKQLKCLIFDNLLIQKKVACKTFENKILNFEASELPVRAHFHKYSVSGPKPAASPNWKSSSYWKSKNATKHSIA